jgi:hypothetical protein
MTSVEDKLLRAAGSGDAAAARAALDKGADRDCKDKARHARTRGCGTA